MAVIVTPGSTVVDSSGTGEVALVAAPLAGVFRHVISVHHFNPSGNSVDASNSLVLYKKVSGVLHEYASRETPAAGSDDIVTRDKPVILNPTDDSLAIKLSGASTTPWKVHASWVDITP